MIHPLIEKIDLEAIAGCSTRSQLFVLRLDREDPVTGGNKSYKLKYNLEAARKSGTNNLLTFGGAWSNHIAATARLGKQSGFKTIGIIRGEDTGNTTLLRAKRDGMELHFVSRSQYKLRNNPDYLSELSEQFNVPMIIPEGGSNDLGIKGCTEILGAGAEIFDIVTVACGTGATISGLIQSAPPESRLIGFSALHDRGSIARFVTGHVTVRNARWEINSDYAFGGFARTSPALEHFIRDFREITKIRIEPVYTGKLFFGICDLVRLKAIPEGSVILAVHTGGLQYLDPPD
ncbi:MAG TPA: pyridoxal-phosphate dependent enzyme [Bacteroidia bacterium]|nr:pyridoxal-phosphate dependent enzyme [Bacteroidia bacterium]